MTKTFIAWTRFDRRSELLAEQLGASIHFIYRPTRNILNLPLKYIILSIRTWSVLSTERPDLIIVQNPPIVCAFVAYLYSLSQKARFVIDSHTAAFLSPRWSRFLWVHRILSRRALATIVHNELQEEIVKGWDCQYCVLPDPIVDYERGEPCELGGEFNVVVVSTFADDEPLEIVLEAANRLPETDFYITGDFERSSSRLLVNTPQNFHLTGFLPYDRYVGLLIAADVVADLTTRDQTLLCGAFEAVSLGRPLIVSDWPILQRYFNSGVVHVTNTPEGLCEGIRKARREHAALERGISKTRKDLREKWQVGFAQLIRMLEKSPSLSSHPPVG